MDTIGLDLHKRESQLCVLAPDGTAREQRILTSHDRFTAVLGPLAPATVLLEASTESEWVARHLESLGLTVIVADPNFAPMYATRARRVKTDGAMRGRSPRRADWAPSAGRTDCPTPAGTSGRSSPSGRRSCGLGPVTSRSPRRSLGGMDSASPAERVSG